MLKTPSLLAVWVEARKLLITLTCLQSTLWRRVPVLNAKGWHTHKGNCCVHL